MNFWQELKPWDFPLTAAIALGIAAILYFRGCRRSNSPHWRNVCFWTGLLSFYVVLLTRFDYYADHEFFMGVIRQGTSQHVPPFLIAVSAPGMTLKAGLQPLTFPEIGYCFRPLAVAVLFNVVMLLWLVPDVNFITMLDWRLDRVMNAGMTATGLLFWNLALDPHSKYTTGFRIALMLAVIPVQVAAGA